MVRRAELSDIPEIVHWGRKFFDYSPWQGRTEFNEADLSASLEGMITGSGAVFLNGHGICGGVIFPLFFNASMRVAVELFWFADGGGAELREAFEAWAIESGATALQMTCLTDSREPAMRRLLSSKGYTPMEVSFFKEVA